MYQKLFLVFCLLIVNDKTLSQSLPETGSNQEQQPILKQHPIYPSNHQQIDSSHFTYPENTEVKFSSDNQDIDGYAKSQALNEQQESSNVVNYLPPQGVPQYITYGPYARPQILTAPSGLYPIPIGHEGYLVPQPPPSPPPQPTEIDTTTFVQSLPMTEIIFNVMRSIFPGSETFLSIVSRAGSLLLSLLSTVVFGGALTTAICTFTPLCTISFAGLGLPFLRDTPINEIRSFKEKIGAELTPDRIKRAADFLQSALEKYQKMQKEQNDRKSKVIKTQK